MSNGIRIECPHCAVRLRVQSEDALGEEMTCPACHEDFIAEEPIDAPPRRRERASRQRGAGAGRSGSKRSPSGRAAADRSRPTRRRPPAESPRRRPAKAAARRRPPEDDFDDFDDYDEIEDFDQEDDFDERPRRRPSTRKRKKKRAAGGASRTVLVIAGFALALTVAVGVGVVAYKFMPGIGSGGLDLAYLPEDAEIVVRVNVADAADSAFLSDLMNDPTFDNALDQIRREIPGFSITDIDSVTVGVAGIKGSLDSNRLINPLGRSDMNERSIIVVRFNAAPEIKDLESEFFGGEATTVDYGGKQFLKSPRGTDMMCLFRPDDDTWVLGKEDEIKAAIDSGGKSKSRDEFDFVDTSSQVLIIVAPKDPPQNPARGGSSFTDRIAKAQSDHAKAAYFAIDFSSDVDLKIGVKCHDSAGATELAQVVSQGLQEARTGFDNMKGLAPPEAADLVNTADRVLNSIDVDESGDTVTVSGEIPGEIKDQIRQMQGGRGLIPDPGGFGAPPGRRGSSPFGF